MEYVPILLEGAKEDINKYLNNFMKLKVIKKQILRQKASIHSIICETADLFLVDAGVARCHFDFLQPHSWYYWLEKQRWESA